MINNANKFSIAEIFGVDTQVRYRIPKFQREYTWRKENWEELLNDIYESDGNHFIGSIICIRDTSTDIYKTELELIDGQQRLTTISILYATIYKILKENVTESDDELNAELLNIKWKLITKKEKEVRLKLSSQNNNYTDYQSVLDEARLYTFENHALNKGNRLIFKCFRFYQSKLVDKSLEELLELIEKLNNILLVKIEVDSHSDAFMLFESLNNRGIPLSAIDLIKNKILAEIEKQKSDLTPDQAFERWKTIVENLGEYNIQERFLRQFYNAFKTDKQIKVDKFNKATKSNLIKIYEELISRNPEKIFDDLINKSKIYKNLTSLDATDDMYSKELTKEFTDLWNVKAAPGYTVLLYIFTKFPQLGISEFKKIIILLVNFFIRRNITDYPGTRNLDQISIDIIEAIENRPTESVHEVVVSIIKQKNNLASLELFREKLSGDIYDMNIDATRFILSKIEQTHNTKEIFRDFWERDKNGKQLIWTIEHIFPEGKNIPTEWVNMIANGDRAKAEEIQSEYVHKLGNLTLTGVNSNLSNFDFIKKRDRTDSNNNNIGYKNGLFLNSKIASLNSWTVENIKERTSELVQMAIELFKFDFE